jgi:hypothetical protein
MTLITNLGDFGRFYENWRGCGGQRAHAGSGTGDRARPAGGHSVRWHPVRKIRALRASAPASRRRPSGADAAVQARRVSLRWILLHMVEEYARHNGHADLLRARIDGATGD